MASDHTFDVCRLVAGDQAIEHKRHESAGAGQYQLSYPVSFVALPSSVDARQHEVSRVRRMNRDIPFELTRYPGIGGTFVRPDANDVSTALHGPDSVDSHLGGGREERLAGKIKGRRHVANDTGLAEPTRGEA